MQTDTTEPTETLAERAWLAYHSLPRGEDGKPPPSTALEAKHDLSRGILGKTFRGNVTNHTADVLSKIADALNTTSDFLLRGRGARPVPTGRVPLPDGSEYPPVMPPRYQALVDVFEERIRQKRPVANEVKEELLAELLHSESDPGHEFWRTRIRTVEAQHRDRDERAAIPRSPIEPLPERDDTPPKRRKPRA